MPKSPHCLHKWVCLKGKLGYRIYLKVVLLLVAQIYHSPVYDSVWYTGVNRPDDCGTCSWQFKELTMKWNWDWLPVWKCLLVACLRFLRGYFLSWPGKVLCLNRVEQMQFLASPMGKGSWLAVQEDSSAFDASWCRANVRLNSLTWSVRSSVQVAGMSFFPIFSLKILSTQA